MSQAKNNILTSLHLRAPLLILVFWGMFSLIPSSGKSAVTWGVPPVIFQSNDSIVIQWETLTETNNAFFWIALIDSSFAYNLGSFPSSVTNSTTPTSYEIRVPKPASTTGFACAVIHTEDLSGTTGNYTPQFCTYITTASTLVWPGDANSDGIADLDDLLAIGLANGAFGPPRANPSLAWTGQVATDFNSSFGNGLNHKFSDCDGNGTVDLNDTLSINQNFGNTHNKTSAITTGGVPLTLIYPDSVNSSDTVEIEIWLGDVNNPVTNAYGLSFSMLYDTAQVQEALTGATIDTSWFGTPGLDLVRMYRDDAMGQLDFAATRTDGNGVNGFGRIGSIGIVMVENLGKVAFDAELMIEGVDPLLLDGDGNRILVNMNVLTGSSFFPDLVMEPGFSLYPNPCQDEFYLKTPAGTQNEIGEIRIFDSKGMRIKLPNRMNSEGFQLSTAGLPAGIYYLVAFRDGIPIGRKAFVKAEYNW